MMGEQNPEAVKRPPGAKKVNLNPFLELVRSAFERGGSFSGRIGSLLRRFFYVGKGIVRFVQIAADASGLIRRHDSVISGHDGVRRRLLRFRRHHARPER